MDIITDFSNMSPEQTISYCHQVLGIRERSPEEWEAYYREEAERERRHQAQLKEIYESKDARYYPVFKKTCPICKTEFYTQNPRKIYDDYYKCSRYQHRKNAKFARKLNRITTCEECGKVFVPLRSGARYCSAACKQKSYRAEKTNRTT